MSCIVITQIAKSVTMVGFESKHAVGACEVDGRSVIVYRFGDEAIYYRPNVVPQVALDVISLLITHARGCPECKVKCFTILCEISNHAKIK